MNIVYTEIETLKEINYDAIAPLWEEKTKKSINDLETLKTHIQARQDAIAVEKNKEVRTKKIQELTKLQFQIQDVINHYNLYGEQEEISKTPKHLK